MRIYDVVILLGLAFVCSPAEAQYGPVQEFLINCDAGLSHPDCPETNITDDFIGAYSNFVSKPQQDHRVQRREKGSKFLWMNPCRYPPFYFDRLIADQNRAVNDSTLEILRIGIHIATKAKGTCDRLKAVFAVKKFGLTSSELHDTFKHTCFYWLPSVEQIPKSLGMPLKWSYLRGLLDKQNSTLENCYRYLQYYSIAVEKITDDLLRKPKGSIDDQEITKKFVEVEYQLRAVLCELECILFEFFLERFTQHYISPLIFPKYALLNLDETFSMMRDWLIFRDYINFLEYLIEVLDLYEIKEQIRIRQAMRAP